MNARLGFFGKIKAFAVAHKAVSVGIVLSIAAAGYGVETHYKGASTATKYILATVSKKTIISSISGSGQVAAENQVNITSAVSGTIQKIYVSAGDDVTDGQIVASVEDADAVRAVSNAELSLENARVAYDKAVREAGNQAASSSASDLARAYQGGYNAIVATSIDLPAVFSSVSDIYYGSSHSPYFADVNVATQVDAAAAGYKIQSGALFDDARREYTANFLRYKNISANSSPEEISSLLSETNIILQKTLSALSGTYSTIDYIQNRLPKIPAELTADKSTLSTFVSSVNADTTSVTNALTSIDTSKTVGTTADLAAKSAQLTVKQAEASLSDANKALADHRIKAPFAGLIAKVTAKQGDIATNGTDIATIVTKHQIVNISLNEVDAAKVSKGEKATLSFDAIDGLTLAGHVTNVDLVGTVAQGVVTYTAEIAFDDIDPRIKPGMTVNASIITSIKQDVLAVPSSAVKTQKGSAYVQVLDQKYDEALAAQGVSSPVLPSNVPVTVGMSNDSSVEIVSGIAEGDQVVSRIVTGASKASTAPSLLSGLGGGNRGGGGGNAARALGR